jgi:hypothetical protein
VHELFFTYLRRRWRRNLAADYPAGRGTPI